MQEREKKTNKKLKIQTSLNLSGINDWLLINESVICFLFVLQFFVQYLDRVRG